MPYDYAKLKGRITERFGTRARFSDAMGLSERSISLKLNGEVGWKQKDIALACQLLDIRDEEIAAYFFSM